MTEPTAQSLLRSAEFDKENVSPPESSPQSDLRNVTDPNLEYTMTKQTGKRRPSSCVFVASLRSTRTDDELCLAVRAHFRSFGDLASVKVLRDPENRPYAFVQYTNDADCQNAIVNGHNSELDGRKLRCEAAKVNRTLFLACHHPMNADDIQHLVQQFGETDLIAPSTPSGRVCQNIPAGACCNWFVKFTYRDDAIRAFASLADSEFYHVEWAQNIDDIVVKGGSVNRYAIFVGQLPPVATEEHVRAYFSSHGPIRDVSVIHRPQTSFAFVTYETEAAAASAVATENHSLFTNKTIHVQYRELSGRSTSRVILSPRVPVALAPPPVHVNRSTLSHLKRSMAAKGSVSERVPRHKVLAKSNLRSPSGSFSKYWVRDQGKQDGPLNVPHDSSSDSLYFLIPGDNKSA